MPDRGLLMRDGRVQQATEDFLANRPPPPARRDRPPGAAPSPIAQDTPNRPTQAPVAFAWFPAIDYPGALRRWPELTHQGPAKGAADHAAYNLALQRTLAGYADSGLSRLHVAAVRVEPFLGWCDRAGRDPATPDARSGYAAELLRLADPAVVAWPPGRNQRCWCGSDRKYKQCCGSTAR